MGVSIYLSNSNVKIAIGTGGRDKVAMQKLYNVKIQEGSLLNGVITSEGELARELTGLWEKLHLPKKDVRLTIDSTQFFVKVVTIPKLSDKKTREMLKNEFPDLENPEGYLYDYRVLEKEESENGLVSAICTAVQKDFIEGYVHLFETVGVQLETIDLSLNGRLKVFHNLMDVSEETFVSAALDGSNLSSTLFVEGKYKFFNRTRIFSEHGTEGFGLEIARTMSSIMQFLASEKSSYTIEDVYLSGFRKDDVPVCVNAIEGLGLQAGLMEGLKTVQMPLPENVYCDEPEAAPVSAGDYMDLLGAMLTESKDINFYRRFELSAKAKHSSFRWKSILPQIVIFGACAAVSLGLLGMNLMKGREIAGVDAYLNDPDNMAKFEESQKVQTELSLLESNIQVTELGWDVIHSYPLANSKIQTAVLVCAADKVSITVDSYDALSGVYEFTAMAADVTTIYNFIDQLRETGLFADLEYSGYHFTEQSAQFDIQVSGYLGEAAGK